MKENKNVRMYAVINYFAFKAIEFIKLTLNVNKTTHSIVVEIKSMNN
jgi:hypothetical protein